MTTTPSGTPFTSNMEEGGYLTGYLDGNLFTIFNGGLELGVAKWADDALCAVSRFDHSELWDTYAIEWESNRDPTPITDALSDFDEQIEAHLSLEDRVTDHEQDHSDAGGRLCKDENDDGTCAVCGVGLDKCETCDGLGYHFGGCPDSDATDVRLTGGTLLSADFALDQIAALYTEEMSGANFVNDALPILVAAGFRYTRDGEVVREGGAS